MMLMVTFRVRVSLCMAPESSYQCVDFGHEISAFRE